MRKGKEGSGGKNTSTTIGQVARRENSTQQASTLLPTSPPASDVPRRRREAGLKENPEVSV